MSKLKNSRSVYIHAEEDTQDTKLTYAERLKKRRQERKSKDFQMATGRRNSRNQRRLSEQWARSRNRVYRPSLSGGLSIAEPRRLDKMLKSRPNAKIR